MTALNFLIQSFNSSYIIHRSTGFSGDLQSIPPTRQRLYILLSILFSKIEHITGYKVSLNKYKKQTNKQNRILCIISNHSKLESIPRLTSENT